MVDDRCGLLGDALEQPSVIVGVLRTMHVVNGQCSDAMAVEGEGADERGLEGRLRFLTTGRVEIHAGSTVDHSPPIAGRPSAQTVAISHREPSDEIGLDSRCERAVKSARLPDAQEERTGGKGNEIAQFRRDQLHRVGDAKTAAHSLCDLVQAVDLTLGERDVVKHAPAVRPCVAWSRRRLRWRWQLAISRDLVRYRWIDREECLYNRWVERLTAFLAEGRQRRLDAERALVRPF